MQYVLNVEFQCTTDRKNEWVGCDGCDAWYHVKCTHLKGKRKDYFVRTVCKLKFKVLVVQASICGSLYIVVFFYNVSYSVRCLILHSEQLL